MAVSGWRVLVTSAIALLIACDLGGAQVAPPTEDLIAGPAAGPWRRLFLDAMVVERSHGLDRVFHAADKHEANPLIVADRPWEQGGSYSGPYLYGTVMWDEGRLRMWYHVHHGGGYRTPYAETADGIHWDKPSLGIIEEDGSTENNLVVGMSADPEEADNPRRAAGQCHNPSVIERPWEPDPEKRYALFCYGVDHRHARVAFSPDGLHWTWPEESREQGLFGSGDVLNFFWDPYQSRYVATWKTGNRRGRAAGVAWSDDGLEWTKPVEGPVMVADDLDPDATQIYGMPVFPYQGLYIGLPWIYNSRWFKYGGYTDQRMYEVEQGSPCTMDVQLAWSWDLINWTRSWPRYQFIPRGTEGEFDSGMIYTARAPVQMGDELWFYYGGWVGAHNDPSAHAAIGVATLRLDGFCSMHAEEKGWLITRREPFTVPRVTVNVRCGEDGYIMAELLDAEGNVIPGFSEDECVGFGGDSVRRVIYWRTHELPEELRRADKKIRFILRDADLYSYLPDQTAEPETVIWDPGANGGLLPFDEQIAEHQRFRRLGDAAGYVMAEEDGLAYADLHSAAERKTTAALGRDVSFDDDTDWCVEQWCRVVDQGTEPVYGLATFFRPNAGRAAGLYLSESAAGIMTQSGNDYDVPARRDMDTTDGFHWYRMVHEGGAEGTVALFVDGEEVCRVPMTDLRHNTVRGLNVILGPNAGHMEGRMHVAKFGYRTGSTEIVFGPLAQ